MSQLYLDFSAKSLRDAGIRVAGDNAESNSPGWQERAITYVRAYCCSHVEFTGEDVRLYAEGLGFELPPHKRAWGAVMISAARAGLIKKIGTRQVKNPRAHCAIATLWQRVFA